MNNIDVYYNLGNGADTVKTLNKQSTNLPVTVGVIVATCVVLTVGVVIFIFILRCVKHHIS